MIVKPGSTDVSTYFHLRLAADGTDATGLTITGIDLQYVRSGAAPSTKADATALAATDSAHGDNQAIEVDATDQPGVYRIDWPDAAFAAGVREVILTVKEATIFTESLRVQLQQVHADVTHWLGAAAATPTVAGVPEVDVTHFGGSAGTFDSGRPAVESVNDPVTVGTNNDKTGYGLADDAITAGKFDESTAFPLASADSGATAVARTGADGDTLETLSDEIAVVDGNVDAIKERTDNLPDDPADASDIAAAFGALNDLDATEVQTAAAAALTAYDPPTRAEATSDKNEILARLQGLVLATGTIGATGNDATHLHLDGLTYGDDEINNYLLVIFDVSASEYHARWVEDWADTGDLATVATLPFTPEASSDTYWLLPIRQDVTGGSGLDAAGVRAAIGMANADLDTQLGAIASDASDAKDAAEANSTAIADLPTNTELATALDALPTAAEIRAEIDSNSTVLAAILEDTGTTLPATLATIAGYLDTEIAAILADTNELQTDWANGGRLDLLIDAIKAKTDSLTFTTAGQVDATAVDVSDKTGYSIGAGGIGASAFAASAIDAAALATDAVGEIVAAVFARAFSAGYSSLTFDQIVKVMVAALAGKASGLETTEATYRNLADTGSTIVATVDADGNRTAVTLNP